MRLGAFGYSKGLLWNGTLKPSSPGLCNVQKLAFKGLKFTWSPIGSESAKVITEKQFCSEVHFRLEKEVLTEQFSNHNSLIKRS